MTAGRSSPVVRALAALLAGVDGPLRGHLVEALTEHQRRCLRSTTVQPSAEVAELLAALKMARNGHGRPDHEQPAVPGDDAAMQPDAYDYRGAGDRLSVSDRTVRRLVARGELPAVDIAGCKRIRARDLDAFLDRLEPETTRSEDDR